MTTTSPGMYYWVTRRRETAWACVLDFYGDACNWWRARMEIFSTCRLVDLFHLTFPGCHCRPPIVIEECDIVSPRTPELLEAGIGSKLAQLRRAIDLAPGLTALDRPREPLQGLVPGLEPGLVEHRRSGRAYAHRPARASTPRRTRPAPVSISPRAALYSAQRELEGGVLGVDVKPLQ